MSTPTQLQEALKEAAPELSGMERWHLTAIGMILTGGNPSYRLENVGTDYSSCAGAWGVSELVWGWVSTDLVAQARQAANAWKRSPLRDRMRYVFESPADRVAWFARLWWHVKEVSSLSKVARPFSEVYPTSKYLGAAHDLFERYPEFEIMSLDENRAAGIPWAMIGGVLAVALVVYLILRR